MKSKHVGLLLRKKINDWLASIKDLKVRTLAENNVLVTGGAIASLLSGEKVNDYDLYFKTQEAAFAVADYYVKQWEAKEQLVVVNSLTSNWRGEEEDRVLIIHKESNKEAYVEGNLEGLEEEELEESLSLSEGKDKYRPIFISSNAITLSDKIQLIIRFFGDVEEIHRNFDYVHALNSYDHARRALDLNPAALECLLTKQLIYHGSLYPVSSIFRIRKFIRRGWTISAGQLVKIMLQINQLDLTNLELLREQLVGVDSAYMGTFISELSRSTDKQRCDPTYLGQLLDQIFD
jgi:hypothetical protein